MSVSALPPTPPTALVIVLGASAWPNSPGFQASQAFVHAAQEFRDYLLDPQGFGLPAVNLLDLFDTQTSSSDQLELLGAFLEQQMQALSAANQAARDVLVYFVGHGGFAGPSADFYLLPHRANASSLRVSGMAIDALAEVLREKARQTRRYLFLDCCFAAAAFRAFQGGPDQTAIKKTLDAFAVQARSSGFPGRGTVLLCSSDQKSPSLLLPDESCTMFSRALLDVLRNGDPHRPLQLSLRDIKELAEDRLAALPEKNAPRPGLHSPDQSEGDVADVPFFPNPAGGIALPPSSLPPTRHPTRFSRRTIVAGLLVGLAVIGTGSSLIWLTQSHPSSNPVPKPALTDAPMFGFDPQHTRFNPNEHILSTGNVSSLVLYWSYPTGEPMYGFSPVIAHGIVCTGSSSGYLYGINASTGAYRWVAPLGQHGISSSPAITNGMVFAGSYDSKLYAFDVSTGARLWISLPTGGKAGSPPTVVNRVVYFGSDDGKLYAIDVSTGAPRWTSAPTGGPINTSPAVANGVVYIGSNGKLYAFDASKGTIRWTAPMNSSINSSPAVSNNTVFIGSIGSTGGKLYTFNASTGAPGWTAFTGTNTNIPSAPPSSPAVSNNTVFIGSTDGRLYTFSASTGAPGWTYLTDGIVLSSPAVANGLVYVGSADDQHGQLYAFDEAAGKKLWSYIGNAIYSSPTVVNGIVYVGADDGKLHAFHLPSASAT